MKLILMRHAEAEAGSDDAARPLSSQGRADLVRQARFLHATGWLLNESLASPLLRAQQSQEILAQELKKLGSLAPAYSEKIEQNLKPGLPSIETARQILEGQDNNACALWIFHAPDVAYLASALSAMPAAGYYFTPGSMLALNLTLPNLAEKAIQIWQTQPEYLRSLL